MAKQTVNLAVSASAATAQLQAKDPLTEVRTTCLVMALPISAAKRESHSGASLCCNTENRTL